MSNLLQLRPVDRKRLDRLQERTENPLTSDDIGYVHTVMSQCFLPYRDPKTLLWQRSNGKYHIPPNLVVELVTAHRKPPEVRICRLRHQSAVGTRPPSTSTPHWPACFARH
jgi:hypothetical protein